MLAVAAHPQERLDFTGAICPGLRVGDRKDQLVGSTLGGSQGVQRGLRGIGEGAYIQAGGKKRSCRSQTDV